MTPVGRRRATRVVALFSLVLAACGSPESGLLPPPSSTSSTSVVPTTQAVDRSLIALEPLPGQTTTTAPIESGRSRLRGRVLGPDGGAGGAVVRVERLVGDAVQRRDVPTGPGGAFDLANVPGGRYRVRAFLSPRLAMMGSEIFFLEDGGDKELELRTEVFDGLTVKGSTNPASPLVGQGVNVAVRVAQRSVDANGVGREVPLPGVPVRIQTSGFAELGRAAAPEPGPDADPASDDEEPETATSRATDPNGVVVFELACDRAGPTSAVAVVGSGDSEESFPIEVPACSPAPTTTAPPAADAPDDATTTSEP